MPEMDGLTLLKEIRERGGQSIFVVATGKRLAHIAKDALNTGADYYLQKGTDIANEVSQLPDFVRTRVSQKNAEDELVAWGRFYNSIVDNGPELICRIKPDGALSFVNEPCVHLLKKPYQQLVQENFFAYVPDSERPEILTCLQALSPQKPDCLLLHNVLAGDDRRVLLEWGYHGFFSAQGVVQEYQLTGRDAGFSHPDSGRMSEQSKNCLLPQPGSGSLSPTGQPDLRDGKGRDRKDRTEKTCAAPGIRGDYKDGRTALKGYIDHKKAFIYIKTR